MSELTFEICGHAGMPVPHELIVPKDASTCLAILLPGFGYTCEMPLFYYLESLLGNAGHDVLRVDAQFGKLPELRELSFDERVAWISEDVDAVIQAGIAHRPYREVVIVAKSITTVAIANLLSTVLPSGPRLRIVWLTPLIAIPEQCERIAAIATPGLIVIGDRDPVYDAANMDRLLANKHLQACVIAGGDHSLDIAGDIPASIAALNQAIAAIGAFIDAVPTERQGAIC
jgi:hypothetical protein